MEDPESHTINGLPLGIKLMLIYINTTGYGCSDLKFKGQDYQPAVGSESLNPDPSSPTDFYLLRKLSEEHDSPFLLTINLKDSSQQSQMGNRRPCQPS